jgi:hypothetical protein
MRALVLVLLVSGCSLLFDGGDLHGSHGRPPDLGLIGAPHDIGVPHDLAGAPPLDMGRGLTFATAVYSAGVGVADLALGHFNGAAGHLDAVLIGHTANMAYVFTNKGDGTFNSVSSHAGCTTGTQPGKPWNVVAGDFDNDGNDDVAFTCNDTMAGQDRVTVLLGDGSGGLTRPGGPAFNVGTAFACCDPGTGGNVFNAVALGTGDFNHDGKRDLLVGYNQQANCDLFLGNGTSPLSFGAAIAQALPASSQTAATAVADLNGDGASDAVLATSVGAPILLATQPFVSPPFKETTYFPVATYGGGAGTAMLGALTAGGRPDLLVVIFDNTAMMPGNQIHILRNDGDGNFPGMPQVIPSDPSTSYIAVADFDGDGRPDIASTATDLGHLSIALQNSDTSFKPAVPVTVPLGIVGLVAADVDGDGRVDLLLPSTAAKGLVVLLNRSS